MKRKCSLCNVHISFFNFYTWRDKKVCRSCKTKLDKKDYDFILIYPQAVLILSPISSNELTDDWFVKFLSIAVGSKLDFKDFNLALDLITVFEKNEMVSAIKGNVKKEELTNSDFCVQSVKEAFPNIVDKLHWLRIAQIDDALHSKIMTTIAWIFPIDDLQTAESNSIRYCTEKKEHVKLIEVGVQD